MPFCTQCDATNQGGSAFCTSCGERLQGTDAATGPQPGALLSSLGTAERIGLAGGVLAVLSFFLPWFSIGGFGRTEYLTGIGALQLTGAVLLEPVIAALAVALLLTTRRASTTTRTQVAGWQILLGCTFALPGVIAAMAPIPFLAGTLAFGWWGVTVGYVLIIVGGFILLSALAVGPRAAGAES